MRDQGTFLPDDADRAVLVGRLWIDGDCAGPTPVVLRGDVFHDLFGLAPTMSDLCDLAEPAAAVRAHAGSPIMTLQDAVAQRRLLAPCDLQAIKAAGVTFADSLIERVVEERAKGDLAAAARFREELAVRMGGNWTTIVPGSKEAERVKALFIEQGLWSQYLEVAIGPDAEIFTKAQPLSAVGYGAEIGIHPKSVWNNPEPEIVLAVSSAGAIVGATLGNDVNLRDFEGRSALLLSKAKDNNASCAIGPFIRLFDDAFGLGDIETADVALEVEGTDGFSTYGVNSMQRISRAPTDLVEATIGPDHQYPDGLMLFLGTMFVPTVDREGSGLGFTHHVGDRVSISSPRLGALVNTVTYSAAAPPWTFGMRALMDSLRARQVRGQA